MTEDALACLQSAAESCIIDLLQNCQKSATHARRVTVMQKDIALVRELSNDPAWRCSQLTTHEKKAVQTAPTAKPKASGRSRQFRVKRTRSASAGPEKNPGLHLRSRPRLTRKVGLHVFWEHDLICSLSHHDLA